MFGPGDDYQVVPDQTPVEALEESADGLRITGQWEFVSVCSSFGVRSWYHSSGGPCVFLFIPHWCDGFSIICPGEFLSFHLFFHCCDGLCITLRICFSLFCHWCDSLSITL